MWKCWKKKPLSITPGGFVGVKTCEPTAGSGTTTLRVCARVWADIVFLSVKQHSPLFTPNHHPTKNGGGTVIQKELLKSPIPIRFHWDCAATHDLAYMSAVNEPAGGLGHVHYVNHVHNTCLVRTVNWRTILSGIWSVFQCSLSGNCMHPNHIASSLSNLLSMDSWPHV